MATNKEMQLESSPTESNSQLLNSWMGDNWAISHDDSDTLLPIINPTSIEELLQREQQPFNTVLALWLTINAIIFVAILVGNALTIVAVRTCRNLRSVISNLFILSLAVSDFIVGIALPYHVAFYMGIGHDLGRLRGLCLFRFFLFICACCVSILTLISIAVDRYIAVMYALHYRRYMTRRMAYIIITCNWCVGGLVALIPIFWNKWSETQGCEFDEVLMPWYVAGIITPGFVIIWICMLVFYWRIMREASKQAKRLRQSVVYNTHSSHSILHPDWKSVQIVVFIMGCFTLCWLPYFCVAIAQLLSVCRSSSMIYKTTFSLAMANSALNPIIYSWKNAGFRRAFAQTLCCKSASCCRIDDNDLELHLPSDSVKQRIDSNCDCNSNSNSKSNTSHTSNSKPTKPQTQSSTQCTGAP
ncbi:histamine H2 receptor [Drosophila grimshawi]|uniref:GH17569 n=1 Tax=Drosophila grimshawi TaxID=7222 RepID=B4JXH9_DROGR|nr:histamine H2 receptor [Drosophila grimshawi]EDV95455.1 GH17569 [Drosophila grimshawi]